MLSIASRRGPEATNTAILEDGLIGHTALAFVNVGNNPQPLSENGATLVYNGEIYNWRELNEQYHLNASNDTELLLRGLVQQGPDFLQKIEGQFAFIAQTKETTIVGRDRYGISPLVFGHNSRGELVIASTPEAVAKAGVQQVKTIPAGTYGLVKDNQLDLTFYFQLVPAKEQTPVDPKEILAKAIRSVVVRIPEQQNILYTAMGVLIANLSLLLLLDRLGEILVEQLLLFPGILNNQKTLLSETILKLKQPSKCFSKKVLLLTTMLFS
jgi:asparagine synthetase B (glutamine-hydrolysing)